MLFFEKYMNQKKVTYQYASKEKIHIHQKKLNFMLKQLVFLENLDRIVK